MRRPVCFILAIAVVAVCSAAESPTPARSNAAYESPGVVDNLPAFRNALAERLNFPLSWNPTRFPDFAAWREAARTRYQEALLAEPPRVDFAPQVVGEEDRGTYVAREIVFHVTGDSRVLALMTVPKGAGPFPAVLLLHDHGARFDIGREKVIRPLAGSPRIAEAVAWAEKGYGERFVGDELARRGFVCLAVDALNWGDRGGGGYEGQQALASNLLNLGSSFAAVIAWEDLRAAQFLAGLPAVDSRRVAAVGWSMGGYRACQVAALSDHISAAVAVGWMGTLKGLVQPGSNLTRGASAYTMTHPGLARYLDYPDRVAIACPKPLLIQVGRQDRLYPADDVERAFDRLREVWTAQNAADRLSLRFWDVGHVFDKPMQDEAFGWLETVMRRP